ncbi:GDP-fucose protein O-fucosyltransferase 1-like [Babylonia areolata]|uniref:GDP-fucose protein O-fucosyltransferase 1-like n=1 Tax=Babylonia areolata TaxID=304850 RepID=UPI003FD29620
MDLSAAYRHVFLLQTALLLWKYALSEADDLVEADDMTSSSADATNFGYSDVLKIDANGYLIYCPCMGRFGNQADHFLGSLGFAKKLNRTLILPPWRTYKNIPFDEWFRVDAVRRYHRAITAETFMRILAPAVWPEGQRIGWCWLPKKTDDGESYCPMKEGNPFGPFWDGLGVNFDQHLVYKFSYTEPSKWQKEYPGDMYPVIALKGAPASFPVTEEFVPLQQYLQWSEGLEKQAEDYIQAHFPGETFVGIHLRNGPDWVNACEHAKGSSSFMASPQCLGYKGNRKVTPELCLPSPNTILRETKKVVDSIKATVVYVATDKDPMLEKLKTALGDKVRVIHQDPWLPQVDLVILGRADHFIGNCVSSFTSFVSRQRQHTNKPTSFWAFSDS